MKKLLGSLVLIGFALLSANSAFAALDSAVKQIIALKEPPPGVVFEIVSGNRAKLDTALPRVKDAIEKIRKRFPGLDIAVVSHGYEQFALSKSKQKKHEKAHKTVQSLVKDNVPVHICGTFAEMKGVDASEFPDYVDVAAHGPEQIKDYRRMGYMLVEVD
ncbi:MAG: DsrE family protein [Gammaproteobacteria bacterium]|nr:DsrE family protein [Gammaproteobacteria bacterium]MDH5692107.1 DsrE family protein [Gammaproteobacteria bacterium]